MPTKKTPIKKTTTKKAVAKKDVVKKKTDKYFEAVGRRKCSIARVRLFEDAKSKKDTIVNDKEVKIYFPSAEMRFIIEAPLKITKTKGDFYMTIKVYGGGVKSQAEAVRLGVSRALLKYKPDFRPALKQEGFLKRDPRVKERRKFGLKKARKAPQWSKR